MQEVSVIIPTYNRAGPVVKAVESALAQTLKPHEILVVDDGSTDETREALSRVFGRVTYLRQENAGASSARNLGIRSARGNWIAFLDSDDRWAPEKLERQFEFLRKTGCGVCFTGFAVSDEEHPLRAEDLSLQHPDLLPFVECKEEGLCLTDPVSVIAGSRNHPLLPSMLAERRLIERAGYFDESLVVAEDTKLIYNLAFLSPVAYLNAPLLAVTRSSTIPGLTRDSSLELVAKKYEAYLRVQSEVYWRLIGSDRPEVAVIRQRMGYFMARRAELACGSGKYRVARTLSRSAMALAPGRFVFLQWIAVLLLPGVMGARCRKSTSRRNSQRKADCAWQKPSLRCKGWAEIANHVHFDNWARPSDLSPCGTAPAPAFMIKSQSETVRLIAFYLPQFHPIPENDEWWGKGFTEWTNVAKAKPLFPGHYQPRVPADLGFYDLRVPETRAAQAQLARAAGIEGFCYWHYWFAGKRLLERPFDDVLASGEPDFPFCLAWANETWTGIWHGAPRRILIEQTYPGPADHERHFYSLLPAFLDRRYIQVNGKPLFVVYKPANLPGADRFIEQWQNLASKNGLSGIHFVAHSIILEREYNPWQLGFNAVVFCSALRICEHTKFEVVRIRMARNRDKAADLLVQAQALGLTAQEKARTLHRRWTGRPVQVFDYEDAAAFFMEGIDGTWPGQTIYPCAVPNWDNSPRSGMRAVILDNSTPELFRGHLREVLDRAQRLPGGERIVFAKSWNEWAEGNYLEPDQRFGHQYLDVVRDELRLANRNAVTECDDSFRARRNGPRCAALEG